MVAFIFHTSQGGCDRDNCSANTQLLWSKSVQGLAPDAYAKLEPLLNYRFYIPELHLKDGLAHYGSSVRLRAFVSDLLAGSRPMKVAVIGGRYASRILQ